MGSLSGAATVFSQALHFASGCLGDQWEFAYGAPGFLASYVVSVYLWLVDGLKLAGQGVGAALETAVFWQGYQITLAMPAPPIPTLGASWTGYQNGYGQVRPSTIFNGGDPTGLVTGVSWSSWGNSTATATGTSDYVGPGQSVATGTQEPVTVVAFNLGTCKGKLMYEAIGWYFPGHGEAFNPNSYINICTGDYHGF